VKVALLLIDIQKDFVSGGALAVPDGDSVIRVANQLMTYKGKIFDYVVASQDWHPPKHLSFASQHHGLNQGDVLDIDGVKQTLWPDHCVEGSNGSEFVKGLKLSFIDEIFKKGTSRNRDSYSAFFDNSLIDGSLSFAQLTGKSSEYSGDTGLHAWLSGQGVGKLFVLGLATDYCVRFSVLDALRLGYDVTVVRDGCRSVEFKPGDGVQALQEMHRAGAKLTTSDQLKHQV
jgi:nicotinamidase/pyrazinamidase